MLHVLDRKREPLEVKVSVQEDTESKQCSGIQTNWVPSYPIRPPQKTLCNLKSLERLPTWVQPHLLPCSCAEGHAQMKASVLEHGVMTSKSILTWCLSSGFHSNPPERFIPSWVVPMTQHRLLRLTVSQHHTRTQVSCTPPSGTHILALNNFLFYLFYLLSLLFFFFWWPSS